MKVSDIDVLDHILRYCNLIQDSMNRFGIDLNIFKSDYDYQNSICMSLLQIGELTVKLSDEYKSLTKEVIDWRNIKGLRNVFAHSYETVDLNNIWKVVNENIPDLKAFCDIQINRNDEIDEKIDLDLTL